MIRRGDTRHLVTGLIARTTELGIDRDTLADALGVTRYTINAWHRYRYLPSWTHAVAWADLVHLRLAVVRDGRVFSEGANVPADFGWLRRRQGLLQQDVADRVNTHRAVISMRERQKQEPALATVHDHVTLLGYRLTLLHAQPQAVAG